MQNAILGVMVTLFCLGCTQERANENLYIGLQTKERMTHPQERQNPLYNQNEESYQTYKMQSQKETF